MTGESVPVDPVSVGTKPKHVRLASGGRVHARGTQMKMWGVIAGLLGAAFIAGLYFGILQANWHLFTLKPGWDHLLPYSWWPVYRHTAFRDIAEPAFATMGVLTLIVKPKYWDRRVGTLRLVTAPFILILATFALGIAGTWLLNYAFGRPVLAKFSVGNLALGFIIGHLLKWFWAPVGATIQGRTLEDDADRAAATGKIPAWVKLPLAPPVLRERFSVMYEASRRVKGNIYDEGGTPRWVMVTMIIVFLLIAGLGLTGHYWVGTLHHTIPWIMPVKVK